MLTNTQRKRIVAALGWQLRKSHHEGSYTYYVEDAIGGHGVGDEADVDQWIVEQIQTQE